MQVSDFDYCLPDGLIAQQPLAVRDQSRLLVLDRKSDSLIHSRFDCLPEFLSARDVLIFNDTRVIPARLIGNKVDGGGKAEIFLLNRLSGDTWETLVKPGKKLRPGTKVSFGSELSCEIIAVTDFGGRVVRFVYEGIFEEILDRLGETPLPPYIHETLADKERYQTVYAKVQGSAAAPTAGLHFTDRLLCELKAMGVNMGYVTLHVGLGTFRPVSVDDVTSHKMHREYYSIPPDTAALVNKAKAEGGRIVAVGTTTVRTLETAAAGGRVEAGSGWTDIFIYPGCQFQIVDALVTNFHLPKSTLLMLVSALAGRERVLAAYQAAVAERYRFFSFGDAMMII